MGVILILPIIQLEFIQKLSPNITWGILPGEGIVPFLDLLKLQENLNSITPDTTVPQQSTDTTEEVPEETTAE